MVLQKIRFTSINKRFTKYDPENTQWTVLQLALQYKFVVNLKNMAGFIKRTNIYFASPKAPTPSHTKQAGYWIPRSLSGAARRWAICIHRAVHRRRNISAVHCRFARWQFCNITVQRPRSPGTGYGCSFGAKLYFIRIIFLSRRLIRRPSWTARRTRHPTRTCLWRRARMTGPFVFCICICSIFLCWAWENINVCLSILK